MSKPVTPHDSARDRFGLKRPKTLKQIEQRAAALAKHASKQAVAA